MKSVKLDTLIVKHNVNRLMNRTELGLRVSAVAAQNQSQLKKDIEVFKRTGRPGELGSNPAVNPLLRLYSIPFNSNAEVKRFFRTSEDETEEDALGRVLELQRWLFRNITYGQANFILKMASMLMTKEYRLRKNYPTQRE